MKIKMAIAAFFLFPTILFSQVLSVNFGRVNEVEFVGLEKWTPKMIFGELAKCTDGLCKKGDTFKIYCNDCLKRVLPFPEIHAASNLKKDRKISVVITVVEPQYADQIKYLELPNDSLQTKEEWKPLIKISKDLSVEFQVAVQVFHSLFANRSPSEIDSILIDFEQQGFDKSSMKNIWKTIASFKDENCFNSACAALQKDRNPQNRFAALSVLLNYPDREETYCHLFEVLRSKGSDKENDFAEMVLRSFLSANIPPLKVEKMKEALIPLLRGTKVGSFLLVMDILSRIPDLKESDRQLILQNSRRLRQAYISSSAYGGEMKEIMERFEKRK